MTSAGMAGTPGDDLPATPDWWRRGVGYEVYIRSFADASGDGVGDLEGLTGRLEHLAWLGVTVVWITPFYPSPGFDGGYDVSDYTDVDPLFGDLAAFDRLTARAHELDLRVMVDIVPNHSSSAHPWFTAARSSRTDPHRDWYHWRDSSPDGGRPNNWLSVFGGPAWSWDEGTGQWWLHQFLPEQPDLNWENPDVVAAFDHILRFWMDRGVDGIRIDVAHGLVKHPDLPDLPPAREVVRREVGLSSAYASLEHVHDVDQDGVLDVYRRWRRVLQPYGAVSVGEVSVADPVRLGRYLQEADGLDASFWLSMQDAEWDADDIRRLVDAGLTAGSVHGRPGAGTAWVTDSHDRERSASRYAPRKVAAGATADAARTGRLRSLAMTALMMGLPGVPFLYQGQELGLTDGVVPPDRVQDPIALRQGELERGRDVSRTPMPWEPGEGLGFTRPGVEPWLPFGGRTAEDTVAAQRADDDSVLHAVRRLVQLRREIPDLADAGFAWTVDAGPLVAYRRGGIVVAVNTGSDAQRLPLDGPARLRWSSGGAQAAAGPEDADVLHLPPDAAAVIEISNAG